MAFKTFEELISMASKNPKATLGYVNKAREEGRPVVNPKNTGYSEAAKRRMMQTVKDSHKENDESMQQMMSKRNKRIGY